MSRKPRKRESYADRINRLMSQGFSRSQARGHSRKGELHVVQARKLQRYPGKSAFLKRIYREVTIDRIPDAIELFKLAEREMITIDGVKHFKRAESATDPLTAADLLFALMSDTLEPEAQGRIKDSDQTTVTLERLRMSKDSKLRKLFKL